MGIWQNSCNTHSWPFTCKCSRAFRDEQYILRGFIKGWAPGKLTGCERDLAINLPGCFCLLFLLSFIRQTENAWLKNPTDLQHKNLMKPLHTCTLRKIALFNMKYYYTLLLSNTNAENWNNGSKKRTVTYHTLALVHLILKWDREVEWVRWWKQNLCY